MKNKKKKTKVNTGTRKISIIFIILLFLMGMSVFLYASEPEITDPIDIIFKDKNLYDRIKNCFGKNIVYIATETDAGYNIKVSKSDIQNSLKIITYSLTIILVFFIVGRTCSFLLYL